MPGLVSLRGLLVAVVVLAVAASALAGAPAAGGEPMLRVGVRVALVVFDSSGLLNASSVAFYAGLLLPPGVGDRAWSPLLGSVYLEYNVSIDAFQAPPGAVEELARGLGALYEESGEPGWLGGSGCGAPRGYARVPLVEAYDVVAGEALRVLRAAGADPASYTDVVVLVGDLDGVARVYHARLEAPYLEVPAVLEGVRGWGSMTAGAPPVTFYDLSAPVKPWPSYSVPFGGRAEPAGPESDPCIWSLADPEGYAARLVADHILFHVVGDLIGEAGPLVAVDARVVLLALPGAEGEAERLASTFDAGAFESMVRMLAPWLDVNVTVTVEPAPEALARLYNESRAGGGAAGLDSERLLDALRGVLPPASSCLLECSWTLAVVVAPGPAHLVVSGMGVEATGLLVSPNRAVAVYPGLDGRVLRAGLPRLAAHELGHALGEGHPFQYHGRIRWLMDEQATPMSYMDAGQAAYGPLYAYTAQRLALAYAALLAHASGDPGAWLAVEEAARDYTLQSALQALAAALEAAGRAGVQPPPAPATTTAATATTAATSTAGSPATTTTNSAAAPASGATTAATTTPPAAAAATASTAPAARAATPTAAATPASEGERAPGPSASATRQAAQGAPPAPGGGGGWWGRALPALAVAAVALALAALLAARRR